jgi:hypothetical protein
MRLSPIKRLVLETMWMSGKPAKATEIAKQVGLNFPPVMMHIIGLTRMGYVETPEKGFYAMTRGGREALGFPEINREKAAGILAHAPMEESFHFYADAGKPLSIYATSLQDFCDKIQKIDIGSVEFHTNRRDFEVWFNRLGDPELARKMLIIKQSGFVGKDLRETVYETVKSRYEELADIRSE